MFTGIVTDVGRVTALAPRGDLRVSIKTAYDLSDLAIGASVACSGVCLTVVDKGEDWFAVDVSRETLDCTNLSEWTQGSAVNLERALKVGEELGGHIVAGHVDAVGAISSIKDEGGSKRFQFSIPKKLAGYIAPKGSVAVNGVSLTVNEVEDQADRTIFGVNIIPHTQAQTSFKEAREGDRVNIEADVLARYVARLKEVL